MKPYYGRIYCITFELLEYYKEQYFNATGCICSLSHKDILIRLVSKELKTPLSKLQITINEELDRNVYQVKVISTDPNIQGLTPLAEGGYISKSNFDLNTLKYP